MVKILGVCGSPRKASTYYALEQALEAAKAVEGVEVELIELRGRKMNFCVHCNKCVKEDMDRCIIYKDDMDELYDKFYNADGYIFASPVYEMGITPQLSTFFTRFRATYSVLKRDPNFFMKKVAGAITVGGTRNGGQETAILCIHGFCHTQGIVPVNGAMGVYGGACVWSQDKGAEGAAADEVGMKNVRAIGEKVALMAKIMKAE